MTNQKYISNHRRKMEAMRQRKMKHENKKLRDALKHIHSMANEGLRTHDANSLYQIEADSAAALNLSDKERGIEPREVHHLYTTIGDEECALLNLLMDKVHPILDLERAGYYASIIRLTACEFVEEFVVDGFRYLMISNKGREYVHQEWGQ